MGQIAAAEPRCYTVGATVILRDSNITFSEAALCTVPQVPCLLTREINPLLLETLSVSCERTPTARKVMIHFRPLREIYTFHDKRAIGN